MSDDDFLRVEASDCPMSSCAAPAGSPCRTGRGKVAAQYHTAPVPARAPPGQGAQRPGPAAAQAGLGLGRAAPPGASRHDTGRARADRARPRRHLGRVLASHDLPLRARVAAAIVLLYAQPLSRIVRLTLDDVTRDGGQVLLRLGEPPSPVPAPVADLLLEWIGNRDNMNTATNHNSPWLFPGRKAGQPMNPNVLAALVNDISVPTIAGRASAIRQHVLEMPAPVVADALSYHPVTTAKLAAQAGGAWSRYAPGDHLRPSSGRRPGETDS